MITSRMTESAQKILFAFSPLRIPAIIRSCFCILIVVSVAYGQTTYYVSSSTGSDGNSGTSAGTPWRTMNKVSKTSFSPGDSILFKRGDTFYYGELSKEGAGWIGTSNAPIVMASYGSGNLPILYGDFTGATWTKTTEFGHDSIWQTYAGICLSGQGWEFYGGTWNIMTHDVLNAVFSMNNTDSLKKFLNSLTTDSFGPASATNNTGDTIYVKTHDGLSPNVHIFRSNVLTGTYLTVRDLEFRNWWTGVDPYNGNHEVFRHLKMRNNRYVAIFLSGGTSNSLVDSCRCDSTGYDAIYGFGGDHNRFNYDTVQTVTETILGIDHKVELAGIGVQQDTSVVIDHCYFADCELDGMAGFFNVQDTVRYCTFSNVATGLYLNGEGWVAHNNTIVVNGSASAPAIQVDLHGGSTPTSVYNNTVTTNGNALLFNSSNAVGGTVSFHNNSVTLTGPSNTRFVDFQVTTGITSTNNSFSGTGVFNAGKFPSEHIYNTLASFHAATGYETGSKPLVVFSSTVKQIIFGQEKLNQPKDTTASITNEGGDTLKITATTSTNNVFSPRQTTKGIAFEQPFMDTIRFTPTSFGDTSGKIIITTNDPLLAHDTIKVSGSSPFPTIAVNQPSFNFGSVVRNAAKPQTIEITNSSINTLLVDSIYTKTLLFVVNKIRDTVSATDSTVVVTFTPAAFGSVKDTLYLRNNSTLPLTFKTVPLSGTSPFPTLGLNQSSLNFGNVVRGTPKLQAIQITNSSINTLIVDSIYTKSSLFAVNKTKDSVSTNDSVIITFTPAGFGSFIDTLYLRNNSASTLIKVPLAGTSPFPTLVLNPSSLNFGNVGRDSSKQQMLQISNSTVNLLTIDSLYTKSPVFKVARTNISIPTIDSVAVTFSPVAVGGFTDTLYLRNNSISAIIKVPLTGNCPSPLIISLANGIFFSDRTLQDSAVITVYARNASIIPLTISNITTTNSAFSISPKTIGIPGKDSAALRVVFKPVLFGTVIDTMTVISDAGVVKTPLGGTSPYPVISVNKSAINFGLAAANDSNYQAILIKNTSINKLRIDSSYTANSIFVSQIRNAVISDSLNTLILCYSKNAGVYGDTLFFKNNSATPLFKVPIAVRLYSKPGRPQSPRISPSSWTNTTSDTVAWNVSQAGMLPTPRAWYSLDTLPHVSSTLLSQTIVNNSFVLSMNKVGTHIVYFYLEDSLGNKSPDSTGFVVARFDTTAPTIQYDAAKPDTVVVQQDGTINTVPPIAASAIKSSNESPVASMKLNYRRVNDTSSSSKDFPGVSNLSYALPVSAFSSGGKTIGVDYQIQATDSAGNASVSNFYSFVMRLAPGAVVANTLGIPSASAYSAAQEVMAYRIFSVPYDLDNKKPSSFMELPQSFGPYLENGKPHILWRMQRLLDSTWQDYESFKDDTVVVPGSAFFIISRDPGKSVAVANAQLVRSDQMFAVGVPLKKGWNLVGNPFLVNIPFDRLRFVGGDLLDRYYYSGTGPQGGWESTGADLDTLRAWQGWAIYVDSACSMRFTIPAPSIPSSAKKTGIKKQTITKIDTTKEWTLQISASRSDIQMSYTGAEIGMKLQSREGYDNNDRFTPPFVGDRNILVGFNSEAGSLLKDMRPISDDGDAWDMTVTTGDGNAKATLLFKAVEKIPSANFTVCLLDVSKGLAFNLKSQNSIEATTGKEGFKNYRVLVGTQAFVKKNLNGIAFLPSDPQLYPNYPNPFNPATTIRYAVPNSGSRFRVDLTVYNVLGQEVQTLVKDEKEPGFYEVSFDARHLASGVYFCRIVIAGGGTNYRSTRKMLLIK